MKPKNGSSPANAHKPECRARPFSAEPTRWSPPLEAFRIYATPDGECHFHHIELPTTKRAVHHDSVAFDVIGIIQRLASASLHLGRHARLPGIGTSSGPVLTRLRDRHSASDHGVQFIIFSVIPSGRQGRRFFNTSRPCPGFWYVGG